jgi:hypothetical protein
LCERCREYSADGHLELFKMTVKYDGKGGREQHGFPVEEEMPLLIPKECYRTATVRESAPSLVSHK